MVTAQRQGSEILTTDGEAIDEQRTDGQGTENLEQAKLRALKKFVKEKSF